MKPVTLLYTPSDATLGARLKQDLKTAGLTLYDAVQRGKETLTIVLVSPQIANTPAIMDTIVQALENNQHIIPVMTAAQTQLPKLIDNLMVVDFADGKYPLDALLKRLEQLSAPDAPPPATVLTPSRRKANRRTAWILVIPAVAMFVYGLVLVGVFHVQYPVEEYNLLETQRVDQRNTIIAPTLEAFLPRSSADAQDFALTVQAMPSRLQPFLAETATSFIVGSATPEPTRTATLEN